MPTTFDQDVESSIGKCGTIKFDYDTYIENPGGLNPISAGGAALAGGFFLDASCEVKDEFELAWVQTVTTTITGGDNTGTQGWMLPKKGAGAYPDGGTPTNPAWPSVEPPISPPGMKPTLGYQDFPARDFADGDQVWLAELGLVAIAKKPNTNMMGMMFREVRVLGTFLWGFDLKPKAPFGINNVIASQPNLWGPPTPDYLNTLNSFYDGLGGGDPNAIPPMAPKMTEKFKFSSNNEVFEAVPEPLTLLGAGTALGFGTFFKRELSKKQKKEKAKAQD